MPSPKRSCTLEPVPWDIGTERSRGWRRQVWKGFVSLCLCCECQKCQNHNTAPIAVLGSLRVREKWAEPRLWCTRSRGEGVSRLPTLSVVVITTVTKSSVVSKGLIFVSQLTAHHEGKSGQEMEQRPWKDAAHRLPRLSLSFYVQTRTVSPEMEMPTVQWAHSHQSRKFPHRLAYRPIPWWHFLNGFFSSQTTLSCAKLTRKQTKLASLEPLTGLSKWAPLPIFLDGAAGAYAGPCS